jgi:hypothetical protein
MPLKFRDGRAIDAYLRNRCSAAAGIRFQVGIGLPVYRIV